jgi:hypothetical protein
MIDLDSGNYIFKFYPISFSLVKTLLYKEVWFSSLKSFNDPFEAEFKIKSTGGELDEYAHYFYSTYMDYQGEPLNYVMMKYHENPEYLFKDLKDTYRDFLDERYGVSCFSRKYNNILMWSHYADSHKGVCLVFNKQKLYENFKKNEIKIFEPEDIYTDKLIEVKTSFTHKKATFDNSDVVIQKKSKLWEYEEEVRFILDLSKNHKNRFVPFDTTHLEAIILGDQVGDEDGFLAYKLGRQINDTLPIIKAQKDLMSNCIKVDETEVNMVIMHHLYNNSEHI